MLIKNIFQEARTLQLERVGFIKNVILSYFGE